MDKDNYITITEKGMVIAQRTLDRHEILSSFFISIGVNEETALADACKIEHDISPETFEAFCKYIESHK